MALHKTIILISEHRSRIRWRLFLGWMSHGHTSTQYAITILRITERQEFEEVFAERGALE
ncbi:MAG: hypothetical protein DMG26_20345 [Acidobacteria bacterium]|nr:MAG: hypothetical protein DMG26_20345 [Acidobacteriota bacterium]